MPVSSSLTRSTLGSSEKAGPSSPSVSRGLIKEIGVAAIPPTEFYTPANEKEAENYLRFAVCKDDEVLDAAKEKLLGLRKFM